MRLNAIQSLCSLVILAGCSTSDGTPPAVDGSGVGPVDTAVAADAMGSQPALEDVTTRVGDTGVVTDLGSSADGATSVEDAETGPADVSEQDSGSPDVTADGGGFFEPVTDGGGDDTATDVGGSDDGGAPAPADVGAVDAAVPDDVSSAVPDVDGQDVGEVLPDVGGDGDVSFGADSAEDIVAMEDVGPPEPEGPLYLLSVNNSTHTLEKIEVATGAGTDLCQLAVAYSYPSLTFSRDNVLYASRTGNTLDVIDPCTCAVNTVGSYDGYTGVNGITSDFGLNLFGVSHIQDELITINTSTGAGTGIGPLGVNFGYTGATWSEAEQTVYAIDASSDALFLISPDTGAATLVASLSQPMGTVGIEMHPANGLLYACSDAAHLLEIDIATGEVTDIGDMGQNTACNNLAAPWKKVECLEEP